MKNLFIIILTFFIFSAKAQVVGNKTIETKSYELEEVYRINIQMYAKVTIDVDKKAGIMIKGESNIIDLIRKDVNNGILTLDQKEWIEPTKEIEIVIGAPGLKELEMGTHDKTKVENIKGDLFKVDAPIGNVILSGRVDKLFVISKKGRVDASELLSLSAEVVINNDGKVIVNVSQQVKCDIHEDGSFININKSGGSIDCTTESADFEENNIQIQYINLKIKNNSLKRNHFVVVGPKPDGRNFSYGFPLMPYQTKKERWTIGTKIYKENAMGIRNLLITLSAEDEDQTIKLFH